MLGGGGSGLCRVRDWLGYLNFILGVRRIEMRFVLGTYREFIDLVREGFLEYVV